jgi:UDP-N-acetyl-D-mannosaminuronate dehydrogenase
MLRDSAVVIAGMGEVGKPLANILSKTYECVNVDIAPVEIDKPCSVLHICYPFQIGDFATTTAKYIRKYKPALTVINSTVTPGTTRRIQMTVGQESHLAYSPVRGKHARMESDMQRYKKFVSAFTEDALISAKSHFEGAGFQTDTFRTPEIAELSKLIETTALGVQIAWAQEMERLAARYEASFDEVNAILKEIDFLPSNVFPGVIGGHCVMPNIALLKTQFQSQFLDTIVESNRAKQSKEQTAPLHAGAKR